MVGGVDRYYQMARCLRDEDLRADRQFEFTQLDAEASFVDQADVIAFISEAVVAAIEAGGRGYPGRIPHMTWQEAQESYGTDKPDLRFGMEIMDLTPVFENTEFRAFLPPAAVKAIRVPGGAADPRPGRPRPPRRPGQAGGGRGPGVDEGRRRVRARLAGGQVPGRRRAEEPAGRHRVAAGRPAAHRGRRAARSPTTCSGILRLDLGRPPVTEGGTKLVWVTDFPLFEGLDAEGRPIPAHHPFTMPHPDDLDRLESDPLSVRSQAYDLVLNGWELGSGSVRIHRSDVQQRVFSLLGIGPEEAQRKFGFLLDGFRHGAPPHAGFAFGIDRLVAILAGEENIREVIAFPKTQSGVDPLTGAPGPLDERQLAELGLRLREPQALATSPATSGIGRASGRRRCRAGTRAGPAASGPHRARSPIGRVGGAGPRCRMISTGTVSRSAVRAPKVVSERGLSTDLIGCGPEAGRGATATDVGGPGTAPAPAPSGYDRRGRTGDGRRPDRRPLVLEQPVEAGCRIGAGRPAALGAWRP